MSIRHPNSFNQWCPTSCLFIIQKRWECNGLSCSCKRQATPTPSPHLPRQADLQIPAWVSLWERQFLFLPSLHFSPSTVSVCVSVSPSLPPSLPFSPSLLHNPQNKYPTSLCMACLSTTLSLTRRVAPCPGPATFRDLRLGVLACPSVCLCSCDWLPC